MAIPRCTESASDGTATRMPAKKTGAGAAPKTSEFIDTLRAHALGLSGAEEGIACQGTALEKRTVHVKKKAFVFLGADHVMVKLHDSLEDAKRLAAQDPAAYRAGANGWVTIRFVDGQALPVEQVSHWIDESYRLLAGKN